MNNKKYLNFGLLLMTALFAVSFISAAGLTPNNVTMNTPGASAVIGGISYKWNCTYQSDYADQNWTMGTLYASSPSSENTTNVLIGAIVLNQTANVINGTALTKDAIEDASDYTVTCALFNGTANVNKSISGITVDNTKPQAPSSISPADGTQYTTSGAQTFSATVIRGNTTACTMTYGRGGISYSSQDSHINQSATYATTSCSKSITFGPSDRGTYWYYLTANDGLNYTDSAIQSFSIAIADIGGGGTSLDLAQANQQVSNGNTNAPNSALGKIFPGLSYKTSVVLLITIIAIVIIIVLILVSSGSKPSKRRRKR